MAKSSNSLLLLLSILFITNILSKITATQVPTNFIKSSCSAATYPSLCVQSLSGYGSTIKQSPSQLAQAAVFVSLSRAKSTQTFISKLRTWKGLKSREIGALKDCLEEVNDTIDRLSKSVKELKNVGDGDSTNSYKSKDFLWHMSNVETWVSAAITDENTCLDGFAGKAMDGKLKKMIKEKIVDVAHVTSNALALINKFANSH